MNIPASMSTIQYITQCLLRLEMYNNNRIYAIIFKGIILFFMYSKVLQKYCNFKNKSELIS